MKIVSLEPFLTELLVSFGLEESVVGISARCAGSTALASRPRVTVTPGAGAIAGARYLDGICEDLLDLGAVQALSADYLLCSLRGETEGSRRLLAAREKLSPLLAEGGRVLSYCPHTLEQVYESFERLGRDLGVVEKGHKLSTRLKAQAMDWCDNFYERMKNKRVSFIASVEPLRLGGMWIPDLIDLASAQSQSPCGGEEHPRVEWSDILNFRPDVIVVAPEGQSVQDSARGFERFLSLPRWEEIPAVKRGEVYFAGGSSHFFRPGPELIESVGILVSAIAGFESGYITPRESFYKLRWLELHRHRLQGI